MKQKIYIFIFAFVLTLSFGSFERILAQKDAKFIHSIDFHGNRIYTDAELLTHIKIRPGERFDEKQASKDLETLLALGYFSKSQTKLITEVYSKNKVAVIFQIQELPIIEEIKIEGLKYITKEEIIFQLKNLKVEVGKPIDYVNVWRAKKAIVEYLIMRGFFDAEVIVTEEEVKAMSLKVGFLIDEMKNDEQNDSDNENQ